MPPRRPAPLGSTEGWPAFIPVPDVRFADYCSAYKNQDGLTREGLRAYCVRVRYTDAYVWAPERRVTPQDPNMWLAYSGERCPHGDAMARDERARPLFCNRVRNGAGNIAYMYQLRPY